MRFSLLQHVEEDRTHYDLFLEEPGRFGQDTNRRLRSFRLAHVPSRAWQEAVELPHHRNLYLSYTGPVTSRGYARLVDKGKVQFLTDTASTVRIILSGKLYRSVLELEHDRFEPALWYCRLAQSNFAFTE